MTRFNSYVKVFFRLINVLVTCWEITWLNKYEHSVFYIFYSKSANIYGMLLLELIFVFNEKGALIYSDSFNENNWIQTEKAWEKQEVKLTLMDLEGRDVTSPLKALCNDCPMLTGEAYRIQNTKSSAKVKRTWMEGKGAFDEVILLLSSSISETDTVYYYSISGCLNFTQLCWVSFFSVSYIFRYCFFIPVPYERLHAYINTCVTSFILLQCIYNSISVVLWALHSRWLLIKVIQIQNNIQGYSIKRVIYSQVMYFPPNFKVHLIVSQTE